MNARDSGKYGTKRTNLAHGQFPSTPACLAAQQTLYPAFPHPAHSMRANWKFRRAPFRTSTRWLSICQRAESYHSTTLQSAFETSDWQMVSSPQTLELSCAWAHLYIVESLRQVPLSYDNTWYIAIYRFFREPKGIEAGMGVDNYISKPTSRSAFSTAFTSISPMWVSKGASTCEGRRHYWISESCEIYVIRVCRTAISQLLVSLSFSFSNKWVSPDTESSRIAPSVPRSPIFKTWREGATTSSTAEFDAQFSVFFVRPYFQMSHQSYF